MIAGLSNKELLLSAYRLRGSELAFAGALKAAAAEFRAVRECDELGAQWIGTTAVRRAVSVSVVPVLFQPLSATSLHCIVLL